MVESTVVGLSNNACADGKHFVEHVVQNNLAKRHVNYFSNATNFGVVSGK